MKTLTEFLNASRARHSHLCRRQVLGVRVALAGLSLLDIELGWQRRKELLVIAETDGCFVDGVEVTAQVSVGHRSLKIEDYGKIAATFVRSLKNISLVKSMLILLNSRDIKSCQTPNCFVRNGST